MNRLQTRRSLSHEAGSAYLLVLLTLVVMTIAGLSLASVTDAERLIGSNERTVHRTFYSAETGLALSAASVLVSSDHAPKQLAMQEAGTSATLEIGHRLELAPVVPIHFGPCNLCEINNVDTAKEDAFLRIDHALTATATRVHTPSGRVLTRKTLGETLELQPWRSPVEVFLATVDSEHVEKVKL